MRKRFLTVGLLALAVGLLSIGQGAGAMKRPPSSHDQPDSVGRDGAAGRIRPGPDLAGQALRAFFCVPDRDGKRALKTV